MVIKKLKEIFMKDAKYELLEDRVRQLEDIIDELIIDVNEDMQDEDECIAILPSSVIDEMEKIVNENIHVIGIT
jgi:hypothetical protein